MTEQIWLLVAEPRRVADGAVETVRLAGGGSKGYKQFGSTSWYAGLDRPPAIAQKLGFTGSGFGEGAVIQASELRWRGSAARQAALGAYYWRDAVFTLYAGPDGGADGDFSILLSGRIADARPVGRGELVLQLVDPTADLAKPILTDTFAGTGGIEGPAELKGQPKWRGWGKLRNVTLRSLKSATNIWVALDPARPLQAIDQVYDKGNAASSLTVVAWAGSIAATLAALEATAAPAGGAAVAPSISCIKWWYANPGKLTADLRGEIGAGYVDRPADIAAALSATVGGPAFNAAMLTAARAARNAEAGWLVQDTNATAAEQIEQILSGVSLWWALPASGEMEIGEWAWGGPVAAVKAASVERTATYQPISKVTVSYRPNYTVMARSDIAAAVLLATDAAYADGTPIEALKPAEAGANVTGTNVAAGFVGQQPIATDPNATPRLSLVYGQARPAGQALNRNDSFELWDGNTPLGWVVTVGSAQQVTSTITRRGRSAARMSGWTELQSDRIPVRAGEKLWLSAGLQNITFDSAGANPGQGRWYLGLGAYRSDGSVQAFHYPLSANHDQGVGYKDFAASWNVPSDVVEIGLVAIFEYTDTLSNGIGDLDYFSVSRVQDAADVTGVNVAAAITGQGGLATRNTVTYGPVDIASLPSAILPANMYSGSIGSQWLFDPSSGTLISSRWPAEYGANVTEIRVAAAISGQGALATRSNARVGLELVDEGGAYLPPAYIKNNNNTAAGSGYVQRPVGGEFSVNATNVPGAIEIRLPNTIADGRYAFIKFQVDIFDYDVGTTVTYDIAGYLYPYGPAPAWINCTAKVIGGGAGSVKPVRFGRTGSAGSDRFCVWIGDVSPATLWQYPQVQVRNVVTGYSAYDISYWQAGWNLTNRTTALPVVDFTVSNPTAGDAVFGVNALESWNGAVATLPNFKTTIGIAAGFAGQGALATQNALAYGGAFLTGFGALAARANVRFANEIFRSNGTTLVVDADAITALGVAAAIVGQGAGATANTLAQLDATAAATLAAAANGGQQSVGINVIRSVLLDIGETINFEVWMSVGAGGSGGDVQVRVERSPADANSWTTISTYTGDFAGPTEPGTVTGSGSFTNSTGVKQRFDFRAVRANPSVGGALVSSQSYLKI